MSYYKVLVGAPSFHGNESLTYEGDDGLATGQIVTVPLQRKQVLGIIVGPTAKPAFTTKNLLQIYDLPLLPGQSLRLLEWIYQYYPSPLGAVVQLFLPKSLPARSLQRLTDWTESNLSASKLPALTEEQIIVLKKINKPSTYLLHGDTGTGKTRVYFELAQRQIKQGHSALILIPEINLTTQFLAFFSQHLRAPVITFHSQLTESQRREAWLNILSAGNKPFLVIGARSAIFMPVRNLGLIVLDEFHDGAYKQEQAPHYATQRVASQLAQIHGATLVLGSATPSVSDYFVAAAKNVPILRMKNLAQPRAARAVTVDIVDLKDHEQFTKSSYLSDKLIKSLEEALVRHEQGLLFLNRRGTARVVICSNCGWQAICPNCDLPLTYHHDYHNLRCHICGYHNSAPSSCPSCNSLEILFKSVGTKAVASELQMLFPGAKIQRYDTDNVKAERLNASYEAVNSGQIDILVGTQTLAKGLDLPHLTVIGVVVADTTLYLPDFTANERTYQLLYQVLGRIGRGNHKGTAIIQTYDPNNALIQAAINRDWPQFYTNELKERETFIFPPFCFLLKLTCRRANNNSARLTAEKLVQGLREAKDLHVTVIGPSPAFHEKVDGRYQWQVVIKAKKRTELLKIISRLPSGWSYDLDPSDLL